MRSFEDITEHVLKNPHIRIATAKASFELFFNIYLGSFLAFKTAPFQKKMFEIAEASADDEPLSVIISFRGSAKTTIMSLAYPIWSILGKQQKKFVLIISDTQDLAKQRLANIRQQLEHNKLLREELGPFRENPPGEWSAGSVVIQRYNARIMVASREQGVRGVIHNQHRPDLVILDDVENLESVRTKESREKTYRWFTEEIQPLGDKYTKIILIGNKLHEDSLYMRLKAQIHSNERSGRYYEFPVQIAGNILWPGKYPNQEALDHEKKKIGDSKAWLREYELKIIPEDNQIIYSEWIKFYDELPDMNDSENGVLLIGVDLAISQNSKSHYTAIVSAFIQFMNNKELKIYILTPLINERLDGPDQIEKIMELNTTLPRNPRRTFYIENVAYQQSLVDHLERKGINVQGVRPKGTKEERLRYVSYMIKNGNVFFPRSGAKDLIDQLVNFGVETYDDLADAFAIILLQIDEDRPTQPIRIKLVPHGLYDRCDPMRGLR